MGFTRNDQALAPAPASFLVTLCTAACFTPPSTMSKMTSRAAVGHVRIASHACYPLQLVKGILGFDLGNIVEPGYCPGHYHTSYYADI